MRKWTIAIRGVDALDDAMSIMALAFPPAFGEAWSSGQLSGVVAMPGATLMIAYEDQPIGLSLTRTVVAETELMLLAVVPEVRGQGLGRALLAAATEQAGAAASRAIFLEVRAGNAAVSLYSSSGFRQVGSRPNYYQGKDGERYDAITMRCDLI